MYNDTVLNSTKHKYTFDNSIIEKLMPICSYERLYSKQVDILISKERCYKYYTL